MATLASADQSAAAPIRSDAARGEAIDSSSLRALWSESDEVVQREHHPGQQTEQSQPTQPQSLLYDTPRDARMTQGDRNDSSSSMRSQRSSAYLQNPVGSPSHTRTGPFIASPNNGRTSPSAQRYSPQAARMQQYSDNLTRMRAGDMTIQGQHGEEGSTSSGHTIPALQAAAGGLTMGAVPTYDSFVPSTSPEVAVRSSDSHAYAQAILARQHYRGASVQYSGLDGAYDSAQLTKQAAQSATSRPDPSAPTTYGIADDQLFFHRDPANAVRRNHTIATDSRPTQRRLDQHFLQVSPGKNSLSAITGGVDGEDDLEAILKRRQSLLPPAADETTEAGPSIWSTSALSSSHKRFPSQPVSTLATSPVINPMRLIEGSSSISRGDGSSSSTHHRSESAHLTGLDQGSFASSPFVLSSAFGNSSGLLRRHQSLNYHLGRNAAARHLGRTEGAEVKPIFNQQASPLGLVTSSSQGGHGAVPMQQTVSTSSFPESIYREPISPYQARQSGQSQFDNDTQLAPSLMEAHARLARMSIMPSEPSSVASGMPTMSTGHGQANNEDENLESLRRLPSLVTDRDVLARATESVDPELKDGPATAAPYFPSIGHAHLGAEHVGSSRPGARARGGLSRNAPRSAYPGTGDWMSKHALSGRQHEKSHDSQGANPSRHSPLPSAFTSTEQSSGMPSHEQQQAQQQHQLFLQQQQMYHLHQIQQLRQLQQAHAANPLLPQNFNVPQQAPLRFGAALQHHPQLPPGVNMQWKPQDQGMYGAVPTLTGQILPPHAIQPPGNAGQLAPSPMAAGQLRRQQSQGINAETRDLMLAKGLNPSPQMFDANPPRARYFVIKSYTEDDVFRSLKHSIWASTEKGNQRLDRAYKESHHDGPIYLFFSCNGSGHFCGVARMLSEVDYTTSASIWSEEGKWKGTFKVEWIYVKDIPNSALRHIRLTNTAECKPIVQSRDTQELPVEGGREALKIFTEHPSRTTLMQDWHFYEQQAQAKEQLQNKGRAQQANDDAMAPVSGPPSAPMAPPASIAPRPPPKSRRRGGRGGGASHDTTDVALPA